MSQINNIKTREILISHYEFGDLDEEYADYIMKHAAGDRVICNGDTLLEAMEDGYLFDDFIDFLMK